MRREEGGLLKKRNLTQSIKLRKRKKEKILPVNKKGKRKRQRKRKKRVRSNEKNHSGKRGGRSCFLKKGGGGNSTGRGRKGVKMLQDSPMGFNPLRKGNRGGKGKESPTSKGKEIRVPFLALPRSRRGGRV